VKLLGTTYDSDDLEGILPLPYVVHITHSVDFRLSRIYLSRASGLLSQLSKNEQTMELSRPTLTGSKGSTLWLPSHRLLQLPRPTLRMNLGRPHEFMLSDNKEEVLPRLRQFWEYQKALSIATWGFLLRTPPQCRLQP